MATVNRGGLSGMMVRRIEDKRPTMGGSARLTAVEQGSGLNKVRPQQPFVPQPAEPFIVGRRAPADVRASAPASRGDPCGRPVPGGLMDGLRSSAPIAGDHKGRPYGGQSFLSGIPPV